MSSLSGESRRLQVAPLDPSTYQRHPIHGAERIWPETNCYADLLIELVHGLGFDPVAMLPFTLAIDFEGDQWTFFKPPHADLYELYGFDIQELAVWRPVVDHVAEQVAAGHPVLVELDSWYLPDTSGSSYRSAHTKSTVGVMDIDVPKRRMGYFHGASYYALEGDDFRDIFLMDGAPHERFLPPYFEYVKWRQGFTAPTGARLVEASLALIPRHLARAPRTNPFTRFRERFTADLEWLMKAEIGVFHAYSFVTLRQYGACYELSETYLSWLAGQGVDGVAEAAAAYRQIAESAKAFQFQLARAMARKRPLDMAPIDAMGEQWQRAMDGLRARFDR
jgi:Domain of unknown function (DUF1839)